MSIPDNPARPVRMPKYAIGVLSPLGGADTTPYSMYRLLGSDFIVLSASLDLKSFKPEDLDNAVAAIDTKLDHVVSRGADIILQSGTPVAMSLGPVGLQRLLDKLHEKTGLPVISSALNAVAAARALKVRKLAVCNKWNDRLNRTQVEFFAHWEIAVTTAAAESQEPADFQSANLRAGAELAYRLGRQALERSPDADALFIGGGAWMAEAAAERLEQDFGRPVITSVNCAVREILKKLGCWRRFPAGYGRVLEVD